jgi:hypothetical protein
MPTDNRNARRLPILILVLFIIFIVLVITFVVLGYTSVDYDEVNSNFVFLMIDFIVFSLV